MKYAVADGARIPMARHHGHCRGTAQELPDIVDFNRVYLGIDPMTQMMPIQPTAHYTMGGIPTNKFGEVVVMIRTRSIPGCMRRGNAPVFRAWANRLGTNSLLDLIVSASTPACAREYAGTPIFRICRTIPPPRRAPSSMGSAMGLEKRMPSISARDEEDHVRGCRHLSQ